MNKLIVIILLCLLITTIDCKKIKKRKCIKEMEWGCNTDYDCCLTSLGLTCYKGLCITNSCYPAWHHCHHDSDCCSGRCIFHNKLYEWVCY